MGYTTLLIISFSFLCTFLVTKFLKPIATHVRLVDKPGGRKKHKGDIPLVGGLSIYIGTTITVLLFLDQPIFIRLFLLAGGLIVFIGAVDDRYDISARLKLLGQILVCSIFVYGLDIKISSLGNLFGFGDIQLGLLAYPLTTMALVGAINAFNMMDGIDGLVGSLAAVSFLVLAFLFGENLNYDFQLLSFIFVTSIAAFLIFNIWGSPENKNLKKVFMGDAGSTFMGLALGVLLIKGSQGPAPAFSPITALWLVLLPMTDMFTIMYRRLKRGRSPMVADRTHIHHVLLRAGFSKSKTLTIIISAQLITAIIGAVMFHKSYSEFKSFLAVVIIWFCYQLMMKKSWRLIRWTKKNINS